MRKNVVLVGVSVVAAAALSTLGVTGASASGPAAKGLVPARAQSTGTSRTPASPGAQLWVARYNGPGNNDDDASSVAVSPGGGMVFVTGESAATRSHQDYATIAYNATTGAQVWVKLYPGLSFRPHNGAGAVAVSPDGKTVFVTGTSTGNHIHGQSPIAAYATVAYNATTGAQLWVERYNGPNVNSENFARSLAVSPGGGTVYVTGTSSSNGHPRENDYATVAYNATTGAQLWVKRYNGPANNDDDASTVAVSPDGNTVFVTGASTAPRSGQDYATVAYNATTGAQLWAERYNGPASRDDAASSVAVSPDGGTVYVTGSSRAAGSDQDYATVAYNAATGAQLWVKRYNGPTNSSNEARSVVVSPDGREIFVTGSSWIQRTFGDYATVAYNAATGAQLWVKRYNGPANGTDEPSSMAVSPTGTTLYVTGESAGTSSSDDYTTIAYNTATGAQLWLKRYNGPGDGVDIAASVAVGPNGTVYVTGDSTGNTSLSDYATVAYSG